MKKTILKITVFILTFLVTLIIMESVMNQGHNNMTMEMARASLPVVNFAQGEVAYNRLFGYVSSSEVAFQRDTLTALGEDRELTMKLRPYGREIEGIAIEVRSADGGRLIEDTEIHDYTPRAEEMTVNFALKDLIERDTRYSLAIVLTLDGDQEVRYYTDVIWGSDLHTEEQFAFARDFHQRLYDKEAAKEITKYLETNASLESNESFHKVNIHSSFKQITWGDLAPTEAGEPMIRLVDCDDSIASLLMDYRIFTGEGTAVTYYQVREYYRIRYTSDRMYLLDYERTTVEMPEDDKLLANDKILLGITDERVPMLESADGNVVVFEAAGRLLCVDVASNKLAVLFSFYDQENMDERTLNDSHAVKILDVDEGGNVCFAVYGYMNRGRHEGEVGIQIYAYNSSMNTVEELLYIPCDKTYTVLKADVDRLLYMNRDQQLYLFMEDTVLHVDLMERTYEELVKIDQQNTLQVSENHKIIVWQEGDDIYHCNMLNVRDLNSDTERTLKAGSGEAIMPLGFMGEDIIYGVARNADIVKDSSGRVLFPMYKVCISNATGVVLKEYQQSNIYVTGCSVVDNQITLDRVRMEEDGSLQSVSADQITNNAEETAYKNIIAVANIDRYEHYVQIQVRAPLDTKSVKVQTPKEVVFEGGRVLTLSLNSDHDRYYVYGPYGVEDVCDTPAAALNLAAAENGSVVDEKGQLIWRKTIRVGRNQIMAIKENSVDEERDSLAVCLDTILRFEGITRNTASLLQRGDTVPDILAGSLTDFKVLDLTGCSLDTVLYYVGRDYPVLAMLEDEAVLVTGFNEYNVVIMDPATNSLYKKGMNDSTEWFARYGNRFVTYIP